MITNDILQTVVVAVFILIEIAAFFAVLPFAIGKMEQFIRNRKHSFEKELESELIAFLDKYDTYTSAYNKLHSIERFLGERQYRAKGGKA